MFREHRQEVARVARMASRAGLVEAFGHVSARTPTGFVITSVAPLLRATADDVVVFEAGTPVEGPMAAAPLETPLHAAVYAVRPDVGAICRGHPPSTVTWGTAGGELPLRHGLGGLAGRVVKVHDDVELVTDAARASAVAAGLAGAHSVILRANGALAVGADPLEAATRLYYVEERARVALAGSVPDDVDAVDTAVWARRLEHSVPELARAMAWFDARFGEAEEP